MPLVFFPSPADPRAMLIRLCCVFLLHLLLCPVPVCQCWETC